MENINENWSKLLQAASKPWVELNALNVNTLNKFVEQVQTLREPTQFQKPSDFMSSPVNIATIVSQIATDYTHKASGILMDSCRESSKVWTEMVQNTSMPGTGQRGQDVKESRHK